MRDNVDVQRLGLVLVWVVATVAVTVLAWRVVLAADAQVSERPITQVVAVPSTAARPTISVPEQTATSLELDPEAPSGTTANTGGGTSTTFGASTSSTSSTTSAAAQITTTSVAFSFKTIPSEGGSVTVRYRPGEVDLVAVIPLSGWAWDLRKQTADEIEGEFRRDGRDITIRARWVDGEFRTDVQS